nr:distal tail protein Dit [Clostridium tetani]
MSKRPSISSPKRIITYIDIPDKSSNLKFDEGTFKDITILVECAVKSKDNLADKIDEIKAWLINIGESDLIFSFQLHKQYIAQVVNMIDFKQVLKYTSRFPIIFNCKPFKYAVKDKIIKVTKNNSTIHNEGSFQSEPVIKVYGSGDMIGDFPVFKVGKNIMGFNGNVSKVEVRINEVWI